MGQTCPNFIRGGPVGSSRKEKILTKIGGKFRTQCKKAVDPSFEMFKNKNTFFPSCEA